MKKMLLLGLILCSVVRAPAQTGEEWFRQRETQKKYLLEQIAALKVYGGHAKKGYEIAGKGWRVIQGVKEGDLKLHSEFFNALASVNPKIKSSSFVAGMIALQVRTLAKLKEVRHQVSISRQLTSAEIKFCNEVLDGLLQEGMDALEEGLLVTTSGELELSDEERLQRIERLYAAVQNLYAATSSLGSEIQLLTVQRRRQQIEITQSEKIKGLR